MANTLKFGNGEWYGKKDTILAYNDLNSNYKPLPFNFSRDSSRTVVNKDGLIEEVGSGQPRIDYLNNTKGALKLEPSRTNIVEYSEDGTQWDAINTTVSLTTDSTSPSGQSSVYKVNDNANDNQHRVDVRPSVTSGTEYTFSVFVKKPSDSDIDFVYLIFTNKFSITRFYFNIAEGTSLDSGGTIESYGNGWYRLSASATANSSGNGFFGVNLTNANNNTTYSGTGNGSMFVWGLQVESNASYPTSYIPTSGGSPVTRVADVCTGAGNEQVFNDSQGVLYVEVKGFKETPSDSGYITISSTSVSFTNAVVLQFRSNGDLRFYFGGSASANIQFIDSSIDFTDNNKIAIQYDSNGSNYKMFVNGVSISRYSLATNQSVNGLSELNLNYSNLGFLGNVKDVRVYNTALTDQELKRLTQ